MSKAKNHDSFDTRNQIGGIANSIGKKLVFTVSVIFITVTILLSLVCAYSVYSSSLATLELSVTGAAQIAADNTYNQIDSIHKVLVEISSNVVIASPDVHNIVKTSALYEKSTTYKKEYASVFMCARKDGIEVTSGADISQEEFFKRAINGEFVLSDPVTRPDNGKLGFIYAVPTYHKGEISGVLYMLFDYEVLYNIISSCAMGETGTAYAVNGKGETVVYYDQELVLQKYNTAIDTQRDPSLKPLADIEINAINGKNGFGKYFYGGINKIAGYAPIKGTDNWGLVANSEQSEFMAKMPISIMMCVVACVVLAMISILIVAKIANGIIVPMGVCVKRLRLLAQGDINSPPPVVKTKDETLFLAQSITSLVNSLSFIVSDQGELLSQMAHGNFNVSSKDPSLYTGDFTSIHDSIMVIRNNLSDAIMQIGISSDQVAAGSEHVSCGAQALSQGSTEQAAAVEQLSATIIDLSSQISASALEAKNTQEVNSSAVDDLSVCGKQMDALVSAMTKISAQASEIGKIIKTIDDIAFQTNILALNAAVEAARAGAAGKGFAVVADEVRNLASKSAQSAKSTSELIANSVLAVKDGSSIASQTAQSLAHVRASSTEINRAISAIAQATAQQSHSISQVTIGVDQISQVTQTNSATAQQSAAASEELSAQADNLKDLVAKFTVYRQKN